MRIMIDTDKCAGHAQCAACAPQVYELDDHGYVLPFDGEVAPEHEGPALAGADACPERAIVVRR